MSKEALAVPRACERRMMHDQDVASAPAQVPSPLLIFHSRRCSKMAIACSQLFGALYYWKIPLPDKTFTNAMYAQRDESQVVQGRQAGECTASRSRWHGFQQLPLLMQEP